MTYPSRKEIGFLDSERFFAVEALQPGVNDGVMSRNMSRKMNLRDTLRFRKETWLLAVWPGFWENGASGKKG
jgi:hypothetical protein